MNSVHTELTIKIEPADGEDEMSIVACDSSEMFSNHDIKVESVNEDSKEFKKHSVDVSNNIKASNHIMERKRDRGKNYTEKDKEIFMQLTKNYTTVIENKKTDSASMRDKINAWNEIAEHFSAISQTGPRSGAQLKLLYETEKRRKGKIEKVELCKADGGLFDSSKSGHFLANNIELKNTYDSNASFDNITNISSNENIVMEEMCQPSFTTIVPNFNSSSSEEEERSFGDVMNKKRKSDGRKDEEPLKKTTRSRKRKSIPNPDISKKEQLKLELLRVRLEKEKIEKKILLLDLKKKRIEMNLSSSDEES